MVFMTLEKKGRENIVGKGENAGFQHFLLFPLSFPNVSFSVLLKVKSIWLRLVKASVLWYKNQSNLSPFILKTTDILFYILIQSYTYNSYIA